MRGSCHWCEQPFTPERLPTRDHVFPRPSGGPRGRVVTACAECNSARSEASYEDYSQAVEIARARAVETGQPYKRPKYRQRGERFVIA